MVDPLADLSVSASCYDIERITSVYSDNTGELWWTKAWFNGQKKGEPAIEISRRLAVAFILDTLDLDSWLSRFWPKQMNAYRLAIEQTRKQLLTGI